MDFQARIEAEELRCNCRNRFELSKEAIAFKLNIMLERSSLDLGVLSSTLG